MKLSILLRHSRPRFWHYLFGPILVWGSWLFARVDITHMGGLMVIIFLLFLLYFFFPANLWVYGINDIADDDTDKFNYKKRGYESKYHHGTNLIPWIVGVQLGYVVLWGCFFVMLMVMGIFPLSMNEITKSLVLLGDYVILLLILIPFLLLSYIYSTKPLRLKARPFRDGISNVLYVITPILLIGIQTYYHHGYLTQVFRYGSIAAWLRCIAMHCFSAIPDIEPDTKAGIMTTAVYLGKSRSLLYCIMLYAIAGIFASQVIGMLGSLMGLIYCGVVGLAFRYDTFVVYKRFPWINALLGMILCFYVYFVL